MNIDHFRRAASLLGVTQAAQLYLGRALNVSEVSLTIPGIRSRVLCRPSESDRRTLSQIFIEKDCDVQLASPPRLIIDGGANVGYASLFLANKFPDARIIAVEPDKTNYKRAQKNCEQYPNITLVQGAIWSSHTLLAIENPHSQSWGFKVHEVQAEEPHMVQAYTIMDLLEMSGSDTIDLLKLDIEGAEEQIFSHPSSDWIDRTKVLVVEIHGADAERAVMDALRKRDFTSSQKMEKVVFVNNAYSHKVAQGAAAG